MIIIVTGNHIYLELFFAHLTSLQLNCVDYLHLEIFPSRQSSDVNFLYFEPFSH